MIEICTNRKAYFDYFVEEKFEAGIVLVGSEVKSLRNKEFSLQDSFVSIQNNEVFLKNAYIKSFDKASSFVPDTRRERKLLLHKNEILKLIRATKEKGYTIVPLKAYFMGKNVKLEIGLCKGKKLYDKRESIKKKDIAREMQREAKI